MGVMVQVMGLLTDDFPRMPTQYLLGSRIAESGPALAVQSVDPLACRIQDQLVHGSQVLQLRQGRVELVLAGGGQI